MIRRLKFLKKYIFLLLLFFTLLLTVKIKFISAQTANTLRDLENQQEVSVPIISPNRDNLVKILITRLEVILKRLKQIAQRIDSRSKKISSLPGFNAQTSNLIDKKNDDLVNLLVKTEEDIAAVKYETSTQDLGLTQDSYKQFRAKVIDIRTALIKIIGLEEEMLTEFSTISSASSKISPQDQH